MFYRQKFVTNSSSTSFIFFGITFGDDAIESIFEKIVPIEERSEEIFQDMAEKVCDWADELEGPIRVHIGFESLCGEVYTIDSFYDLDGGIANVPVEHIVSNMENEKQWSEMIKEFCEKYGITMEPCRWDDGLPKWKVALDIDA